MKNLPQTNQDEWRPEPNMGFWKSFLAAPWGVQMVSILLAIVCLNQLRHSFLTQSLLGYTALCFYLGLLLGILKRRNWARIILVAICILGLAIGVFNIVHTAENSSEIYVAGSAILILFPLLFIIPLFVPKSNRWFKGRSNNEPKGCGLINAVKKTAMSIVAAICTSSFMMLVLGYVALHILTVAMLYTRHGFWGAFAGLFLPAIAEVYMFIRSWVEVGFVNLYTLLFLGLPCLYAAIHLTALLVATIAVRNENE